MKKLIPAISMLLVAACLLGSSTFAWFSMNTTVTATGMQVKATAEEGLVISNAAAGTYNASANSVKTDVAQLFPGSTSNLTTWFHSKSSNPAQANTQQEYTDGTAWANNTDKGNYVVHDFYIRSSGAETLTVGSLDIKSVTATASTQELSKALRVGILVDGDTNAYIYAPITGYTATVTVQPSVGAYTDTGRVSVTAKASNVVSNTTVTSIPANTVNGVHAQVFVWYEGEDASCISDNIITGLDAITITVDFTYTAA